MCAKLTGLTLKETVITDAKVMSFLAARSEVVPAGPLPPLEDLVNRIPAPTRALVDELFRAKFVTVKRVPRSALK